MSEYQYYEWQTIDRPLTGAQQHEVNALSSHMDTITSTQAVVTYSWGDFKHDPADVLLKYFDAFLYDSNFGSRRLMFRLPRAVLDVESVKAYCIEDWVTLEAHGNYYVLAVDWNDEDGGGEYEWVESEGLLGQMTSLREQILQGDTRMLYLIWLKAMETDPDAFEDEPGPPVPSGLKNLNAGLQAFAEFFAINPHLIAAAAASSKKAESAPEPELASAISKLTRTETDSYLSQIVRGEPGAVLLLKKHLMALSGKQPDAPSPSKHSAAEMLEQAEKIAQEEQRKARAEAEKKRIERLEILAEQEKSAWVRVENLLAQKRAGAYDEATQLLVELKEMATYKKRTEEFEQRFQLLRTKYGKSLALLDRFYRAKLLKK